MEQIILNGIHVAELLERISSLVDEKFKKNLDGFFKKTERDEFLSRREVAELLQISLTTLHSWTTSGLLPSYKIGNRVLYDSSQLKEALRNFNSGKEQNIPDNFPRIPISIDKLKLRKTSNKNSSRSKARKIKD